MSSPDLSPIDGRLRVQRALAFGALLLMIVVVVASAWLRLAQPRPACFDWPGCRDALRPTLGVTADAAIGRDPLLLAVRDVGGAAAAWPGWPQWCQGAIHSVARVRRAEMNQVKESRAPSGPDSSPSAAASPIAFDGCSAALATDAG